MLILTYFRSNAYNHRRRRVVYGQYSNDHSRTIGEKDRYQVPCKELAHILRRQLRRQPVLGGAGLLRSHSRRRTSICRYGCLQDVLNCTHSCDLLLMFRHDILTMRQFLQAFIRGLLCNWLVCMAVYMASGASSVASKMTAIFFPISAFIALGHTSSSFRFMPYATLLNEYSQRFGTLSGEHVPHSSWHDERSASLYRGLLPQELTTGHSWKHSRRSALRGGHVRLRLRLSQLDRWSDEFSARRIFPLFHLHHLFFGTECHSYHQKCLRQRVDHLKKEQPPLADEISIEQDPSFREDYRHRLLIA